jgi:glutamyl-tRNA reductase
MQDIAPDVVSIADACLGGLQGRSALLIGPEELRSTYLKLLRQARMKHVYQEDAPARLPAILPYVQLLIYMPTLVRTEDGSITIPQITAASIARGCAGRHTPLLIFDLAPTTSVEELAGLLPAVCLYTPDDIHNILYKTAQKNQDKTALENQAAMKAC